MNFNVRNTHVVEYFFKASGKIWAALCQTNTVIIICLHGIIIIKTNVTTESSNAPVQFITPRDILHLAFHVTANIKNLFTAK